MVYYPESAVHERLTGQGHWELHRVLLPCLGGLLLHSKLGAKAPGNPADIHQSCLLNRFMSTIGFIQLFPGERLRSKWKMASFLP